MQPRTLITDDKHLDIAYQFDVGNDTYFDRRLSVYEEIPEPEPAYSIAGQVVGTLQNFSVVSGAAKSRKTTFVSGIVAAVLSGKFEGITSALKSSKVLYIDTEQGEHHCQKVLKRIEYASGLLPREIEDRLYFLMLRKDSTQNRFKFIEQAIYDRSTVGLDFVVLDGLRDLVLDFNNPEESTFIIDKLLEWTATFNIHILCVLHENKGNNQLRGHLGTEGQNKAEAVIHVEKIDERTSKVEPKFTRNMEFPALAFTISPEGDISMGELEKPEKNKPIEFDVELITGIAVGAFRELPMYTSKQLFNNAIRKFYYECTSKSIGEKKAYNLIETMEAAGIIDVKRINSRTIEIRKKTDWHV